MNFELFYTINCKIDDPIHSWQILYFVEGSLS